jgi:hypothetical protein
MIKWVYREQIPVKKEHLQNLPGKGLFALVTAAFRRPGEIGAVGEMLAKCGETPIGAIN